MIEASYWIVNLMIRDIGIVVGGVLVLITLVELLIKLKEWIS